MRSRIGVSGLLAALLSLPVSTVATAQNKTLCVHDVVAPAVLEVHAEPSSDASVVGQFAADACGVKLTGECRKAWCQMTLGAVSGWVDTKNIGVYEVTATGRRPVDDTRKADAESKPSPLAAAPSQNGATLKTRVTSRPVRSSDRREQARRVRMTHNEMKSDRRDTPRQHQRVLQADTSSGTAPVACVARVEVWDTLRLRKGPGMEHSEVDRIPSWACDVAKAGACSGYWCRVTWRGRSGWVNAYYLRRRHG